MAWHSHSFCKRAQLQKDFFTLFTFFSPNASCVRLLFHEVHNLQMDSGLEERLLNRKLNPTTAKFLILAMAEFSSRKNDSIDIVTKNSPRIPL